LKKGKKCPKCNSPYSNFSLKIWKQKITHSLLCDECDKEEIEKAVNSEWENQQNLIDKGPSPSDVMGFHSSNRRRWRK